MVFKSTTHEVSCPSLQGKLCVHSWGNESNQPIVLLHGFMQQGAAWHEVAQYLAREYYVLAPDLPGHGATELPLAEESFSFDAHVQVAETVIRECANSRPVLLVGYSMGGRVAAYCAQALTSLLEGVVLESAGLGSNNVQEREERARKNKALINRLNTEPFEAFIDFWEKLPLFDSQRALPESVLASQRSARLQNRPEALALSLRYAGQHQMPCQRAGLIDASLPILYMAGALDVTYTKVANSLSSAAGYDIFANSQVSREASLRGVVVPRAGHNIHLENPSEFCTELERFFNQLNVGEQ